MNFRGTEYPWNPCHSQPFVVAFSRRDLPVFAEALSGVEGEVEGTREESAVLSCSFAPDS
jgi:hypothetical protein